MTQDLKKRQLRDKLWGLLRYRSLRYITAWKSPCHLQHWNNVEGMQWGNNVTFINSWVMLDDSSCGLDTEKQTQPVWLWKLERKWNGKSDPFTVCWFVKTNSVSEDSFSVPGQEAGERDPAGKTLERRCRGDMTRTQLKVETSPLSKKREAELTTQREVLVSSWSCALNYGIPPDWCPRQDTPVEITAAWALLLPLCQTIHDLSSSSKL